MASFPIVLKFYLVIYNEQLLTFRGAKDSHFWKFLYSETMFPLIYEFGIKKKQQSFNFWIVAFSVIRYLPFMFSGICFLCFQVIVFYISDN